MTTSTIDTWMAARRTANSFEGVTELDTSLDGSKLRIGLLLSRFNRDIGDGLLAACVETLLKQGVKRENMLLVTVPGALEIPLAARRLAQDGAFDALVAMGAVIRGDTYHFEIVANEMASGIMRVQLDTDIPIANAVLTTETDDQAYSRMAHKGAEAALCAIEMANLTGKS